MVEQLTILDIRNLSISEIYHKIKLSDEKLKEISKIGEKSIDKIINEKYQLEEEKDEQDDGKEKLIEVYRNLIDILKKYVDVDEIYLPIIVTWIMGTYIHEQFRSYPFLFFNAMKGSGKTRVLKLATFLSKEGEICTSMTEAVLFRTKGTLAIDEFEGVTRKGNESLRELLNASYKKGAKVKRMKKVKTLLGEEMKVEEFEIYRPIILANIWGMENVLADRCLSVVLEKSNKKEITRLMELFDEDELILTTKSLLSMISVVLCSVVTPRNMYIGWNNYVTTNYITTGTNNYTKLHEFYKKIKESEIDGRNLELSMPLLIIGYLIDPEVFDIVLENIKHIIEERKIDDIYNNKDVAIIDFVSQEIPKKEYISVNDFTKRFKDFIGDTEEWVNAKFVGRALERTKLVLKKRRASTGIFVMLDYEKAQNKIKMFK